MPNIPTLIARVFGDSEAGARRFGRENNSIRTRFENQPRRRWPRARNARH